ncbi:MAG: peptidoglycan bridge formation glycyltransferase FemA/FemB family protein [Spirochaetales bacterium]|nr:peptidoglycan bridge formation glycyltransferase FemA/FemB family protein [Spirochaetales bacterium]
MNIDIFSKDPHDLYTTPLLQQTAYWSEVKSRLGFIPLAFELEVREKDLHPSLSSSARIRDDILILYRKISDNEAICYSPYGPLLSPDEDRRGDFLESLSESLREVLPKDVILLRFDLPWFDENEDVDMMSMEIMMNWGTVNHNIRHSFSPMLPSNTTFIDLSPSLDDILMNMKNKTRYNIRLSQKRGVTVREGSEKDLPIFLSLYKETAERNGIRNHSSSSFSSLFHTNEDDALVKLLIAEREGESLAALFLSLSDDRASYLYGASSSVGRENMPTYALQMAAIREAKKNGAREYDMFGVAPKGEENHPLSGLSRFKLGFGGKRVKRMGCWDYPLKKEEAERFFLEERGWQKYHER